MLYIHTYINFIYARNLQSSCRANVFANVAVELMYVMYLLANQRLPEGNQILAEIMFLSK